MLRKRDDWDPKQHYKNIGWERKGTNVKSKHKVVWPKLYQMGEVVKDEKNPRENLPKALQGKSLTEQLLADERIRENLQKKFRKRQEISGGWHLKKSEGGTGREGQKKRRIIPQAPKEGAESIKQMMDDKDYQDALDNREREDSDEGYVPPDEGPEPWRVIKPKHIMEGDTPEMAMWREKATWGGKGSRARQKRADAKRRLEALEEVTYASLTCEGQTPPLAIPKSLHSQGQDVKCLPTHLFSLRFIGGSGPPRSGSGRLRTASTHASLFWLHADLSRANIGLSLKLRSCQWPRRCPFATASPSSSRTLFISSLNRALHRRIPFVHWPFCDIHTIKTSTDKTTFPPCCFH